MTEDEAKAFQPVADALRVQAEDRKRLEVEVDALRLRDASASRLIDELRKKLTETASEAGRWMRSERELRAECERWRRAVAIISAREERD